jgi:hypothetical protein
MKESPAYREIMDEGSMLTQRVNILAFVEERFGLTRLARLLRLSVRCLDLAAFHEGLRAELPPRRRPSRRKR